MHNYIAHFGYATGEWDGSQSFVFVFPAATNTDAREMISYHINEYPKHMNCSLDSLERIDATGEIKLVSKKTINKDTLTRRKSKFSWIGNLNAERYGLPGGLHGNDVRFIEAHIGFVNLSDPRELLARCKPFDQEQENKRIKAIYKPNPDDVKVLYEFFTREGYMLKITRNGYLKIVKLQKTG